MVTPFQTPSTIIIGRIGQKLRLFYRIMFGDVSAVKSRGTWFYAEKPRKLALVLNLPQKRPQEIMRWG